MRSRSRFSLHPSAFILLLVTLACNTLLPPRPPVEWNAAADFVVAEAHTGGGMLYEPNAVYQARLWGDGRLIWAAQDSQGRRSVFSASLTPDEMRSVLREFVDAGFFGWDKHYSPGLVYDAPSACLRLSLASASHSVCETLSGAPRQFRPLYARLAGGAGGQAAPYLPDRAYLRLTPSGPSGSSQPWPATVTPTLAEVAAQGGAWIEGDALAFAWAAVNQDPLRPVFQASDGYYSVQLLVPGVTVISPP
jgi:hypothetical protein